MRRHVFPQPPSPTTTSFLEYAGGWVMLVAAERALVEVLIVLTVPLLVRVLSRRLGRRRDGSCRRDDECCVVKEA